MENVWLSIRAVAAFLDGNRDDSEQTLNRLYADLMKRSSAERHSLRRALIVIVAQLSRLEVRVAEHDGPNGSML